MDYVLETNALSKNYGHYKALNRLTMNDPKGTIYGFVGKNGAGKTTLIRLTCGLLQPSSGDYKPDTQADVFAKIKISQLTSALEKVNCKLFSMQERDESLENYYVRLIRGVNYA